jgi:hypothetical protein
VEGAPGRGSAWGVGCLQMPLMAPTVTKGVMGEEKKRKK